MQKENTDKTCSSGNNSMIAIGIAVGTALGVAMGNIAVGLALGAAIGVALRSEQVHKK
jgi:F0F1-type ATP synthase membrane subunit c/vacuolar-type H+-ATPase subunit K